MKDIYKVINNIEIDFSDVERTEVSEFERKKDKRRILNAIRNTNKKNNIKKRIIAAGLMIAVTISISTFIGYYNPALASHLPFIGRLVEEKLIDINPRYKGYINEIGQTASSFGIDLTLENAVVDKNLLFLSFIVKNNNESITEYYSDDYGNEDKTFYEIFNYFDLKINYKEYGVVISTSDYEVIDDNSIRILKYVQLDSDQINDKLDIEIKAPKILDGYRDINMKFSIDTKSIEKETYTKKINRIFYAGNTKCVVDEITVSPLSINVKYYAETEDENFWADFNISDQNGEELVFKGGSINSKGCINYIKGKTQFSMDYLHSENITEINMIPSYGTAYDEENTFMQHLPNESFTIKLK